MKKLMITAGAVAIAAGAFATAPAVYDYKASVKHMYLKEVNARQGNSTVKIYQKYQKTATLKGYLIWDLLGATSRVVNGAACGPQSVAAGRAITTDQIRNRCFLVVQNSSAEAQVRRPKIIPGTLKAKWFDTRYNWNATDGRTLTSGVAEGILFLGGDLRLGTAATATVTANGGGVRPIIYNGAQLAAGNMLGAPANTTAPAMLLDYGWTSAFLFGKYNSPNGSTYWRNIQNVIETRQKVPGIAGGQRFFHDTWMNGTGIGKFTVTDDSDACCGFQIGGVNLRLDTLSGDLKGGLFLCTENGFTVNTYRPLGGFGQWWEEQFYDTGIFTGGTYASAAAAVSGANWLLTPYTGDYDQTDVWTDGEIDQNTTDVVFGTWSIKFLSSNVPSASLTAADLFGIGARATIAAAEALVTAGSPDLTANNEDLNDLNAAIKGAALRLNKDSVFARNATLIPARAVNAVTSKNYDVPLMDRNFAMAYGLHRY